MLNIVNIVNIVNIGHSPTLLFGFNSPMASIFSYLHLVIFISKGENLVIDVRETSELGFLMGFNL